MGQIKPLEWESSFFGFPVASISVLHPDELPGIIHQLTLDKYRLAVMFTGKENREIQQEAAKHNGILVDRKVTFAREVPPDKTFDLYSSRPGLELVVNPRVQPESLFDLAFLAGRYSRFRVDPNIAEQDFRRLYGQWVINSLNGDFADYTLVCKDNKQIKGFLTLSLKNGLAKIGLISVDPSSQHQGIGKSMILESFRLCNLNRVNRIEVVTQTDNLEACFFYEKLGFLVAHVHYVYHFWPGKNMNS